MNAENNKDAVLLRWNATMALLLDLSKDRRLTGLASAYAEMALECMGKISQDGVAKE